MKNKPYRSFESARKFAQTLKIQNQKDWRTYAKSGKLPNYIPRDPPSVYKNEWKGNYGNAGSSSSSSGEGDKFLKFSCFQGDTYEIKLEKISENGYLTVTKRSIYTTALNQFLI